MSANLSENIPTGTATETMMQKSSIYLLGMSNHIFNFIYKTSQYPFVASLCWYVYFKVFFKKKTWFCKVIFAFKKFQEMGTKIESQFLGFRNGFSAGYFPISQEPLD